MGMTENNNRFDLDEQLAGAKSIGICGHIRPDGDAVGSCLGMYLFFRKYYPEVFVRVYLQKPAGIFAFLKGESELCQDADETITYDLFITLDCSDPERLGDYIAYFKKAGRTLCIDHHVTNDAFAQTNYILPEASSTCEIVADLIGIDRIDYDMAQALYMGIAHDTGVFQYKCTSSHTMELAGALMDKGIPYSRIISDTYYVKTYVQQQLLGRALLESVRMLDGRVIFSAVRLKDLDFFCATSMDLEGIVSILRQTTGVEVAIFLYELRPQEWKVSLRSSQIVDVAKIAAFFKGGGHVRAAGCTMQGRMHDVVNNIVEHVARQLEEVEKIQEAEGPEEPDHS